MDTVLLPFAAGFAAGLRSMTPLAALALARSPRVWGTVLTVAAAGEFVADALPNVPPRTAFPSNVFRLAAGGVAGWLIAEARGGEPATGAALGALGALAGTYAGQAARIAAIDAIGAIPAALGEDAVAAVLSALIVTRAR